MANRWIPKPKWLVVVPLLVILAGVAVACGDDATPVPAPTPVPLDIGAIQSAVEAAVAASAPAGASAAEIKSLVETAVNAAKTEGVTQAEVAALVSKAVSDAAATAASPEDIRAMVEKAVSAIPAGPAPISPQEMQSVVEAAVAAGAPPGASAAEIGALVETAVSAATAGGVTKADVEQLVNKAVADAAAAVPEAVTAGDVKKIIEQAIAAIPTPTPIPVTPVPTPEPAMMMGPTGTLKIGWREIWVFSAHPYVPSQGSIHGATMGENLLLVNGRGEFLPKIAKEWSLSPDQLTWTFILNKGVPFHKGYGEVTAEDFMWSATEIFREGNINTFSGVWDRLYNAENGSFKIIDDYTVEVNTGVPQFDMLFRTAKNNTGHIMSKKQGLEVGEEYEKLTAGTGPFEIMEARTDGFLKYKAVDPHWRQTANWAEMVFHAIGEESTRIANFQTGRLDTFQMEFDSKPAVQAMVGTTFLRVEVGAAQHIGIYGNFYANIGKEVGIGPDKQSPGYDPDLPWVSSDPDPESDPWKQAVKVRKAMSIAIDRQTIVDELLGGEGTVGVLWGWEINQWRLPFRWEYDQAKARQLLAEAGYGDGFEIKLTPDIRGVPGEVTSCEAVAAMWEEIGITVKLNKVPYSTVLPELRALTYNQANCHGTSGFTDPLFLADIVFRTVPRFPGGYGHPIVDALLDKAKVTVDLEERFKIEVEWATFAFENALDLGLYGVNILWPLSPRVAGWTAEHQEYGEAKWLTPFEWAPNNTR